MDWSSLLNKVAYCDTMAYGLEQSILLDKILRLYDLHDLRRENPDEKKFWNQFWYRWDYGKLEDARRQAGIDISHDPELRTFHVNYGNFEKAVVSDIIRQVEFYEGGLLREPNHIFHGILEKILLSCQRYIDISNPNPLRLEYKEISKELESRSDGIKGDDEYCEVNVDSQRNEFDLLNKLSFTSGYDEGYIQGIADARSFLSECPGTNVRQIGNLYSCNFRAGYDQGYSHGYCFGKSEFTKFDFRFARGSE